MTGAGKRVAQRAVPLLALELVAAELPRMRDGALAAVGIVVIVWLYLVHDLATGGVRA